MNRAYPLALDHLQQRVPELVKTAKELHQEWEAVRVMGAQHCVLNTTQRLLCLSIVDGLALPLMNMHHVAGSLEQGRAEQVAGRLRDEPLVVLGQGSYRREYRAGGWSGAG